MTSALDTSSGLPAAEQAGSRGAAVRRAMLIALWVQGLYVLWACAAGWFHNDDYAFRGSGAGSPWFSWEYLLQPWGGHLMPLAFAAVQPLAKWGSFEYAPIAVALGAAQALVAYLLYRTLVRHFGYRWRIFALLCLYLTSIPVLQATIWWSAALNALPYLACLVLMADRALRWSRQPGTGHILWLLGLLVAALGFFEKAVLSPLFVAALLWALSPAPSGWAAAKDVARRAWLLWAGTAVVLAAWLVLYLANRTSDLASIPEVAVLTEQVSGGLLGTFMPSLFGGPWSWTHDPVVAGYNASGQLTFLPMLAVAVAVCFVLWVASWGARSRRALLVVPVYGIAMAVLINVGRQMWVFNTAALPRYYADLVVVTVLALAVATTRLVDDPAPAMLRERSPGRWHPVALLVVVGLANLVLLGNLWARTTLVQTWATTTPERPYVERSLESLRQLGSSRQVLNQAVPSQIPLLLFAPYNEYRWFYAGLDDVPGFPGLADELLVFDDDGQVVAGRVIGPATEPGPDTCGYEVGSGRRLPMSAQIIPWVHALELQYVASGETTATLRLQDGTPTRVPIAPGRNTAYLLVDGGGNRLQIVPEDPSVDLCVRRAVLGVTAPEETQPLTPAGDGELPGIR